MRSVLERPSSVRDSANYGGRRTERKSPVLGLGRSDVELGSVLEALRIEFWVR
jgi:hypothetical protein